MNWLLTLHFAFLALSLVSCSHNSYILADNSQPVARAPSSQDAPPVVLDMGGLQSISPCKALRYQMKQESMLLNFMRCNVVLNGQVNPASTYKVESVDLCVAVSQFKDEAQNLHSHFELAGHFGKISNQNQILKNVNVRSTRFSDEAFRKPSGLDFILGEEKIHIQDNTPLSTSIQNIEFDLQKQVLDYSLHNKRDIAFGIVDEKIDDISTQVKCSSEMLYSVSK
jgi:hypothetical protein